MFIITLNVKRISCFLIYGLLLVLIPGIVLFTNRTPENIESFKFLPCNANLDNSNFIVFLASSDSGRKNIEIFDITRGEVVKTTSVTEELKTLAASYIRNVKSLYIKVNAFPNKGYIVKIPLNPPLKTQMPLFTDYGINLISELFIIFPMQEKPYLLVLDKNYSPFFYNFEGNTEKLLSLIDFSDYTGLSN